MNNILESSATMFRSVSRGFNGRIDRDGGKNGAGLLTGVAVVTRGEALGHDLWLDKRFLTETRVAINQSKGIKARFTHPTISGDGLGKYLGRFRNARIDSDRVVADLHLSETSRNTPDGDLGGYVMDLAGEDAEAFGTSIVFARDMKAEESFNSRRDADEDNVDNLRHARMGELFAVDAVDEPAANPGGFFHRGAPDLLEAADDVFEFVLGMRDMDKDADFLGISASRIRAWFARFCESRGVYMVSNCSNDADVRNGKTRNSGPMSAGTKEHRAARAKVFACQNTNDG